MLKQQYKGGIKMTVRLGQLMHVYPDQYEEYERRHNNLFPEMRKALKEAGAHNYSIFLDKNTGNLFAYLEVDNIEKYNQISNSEACKKCGLIWIQLWILIRTKVQSLSI